LLRETPQDPDLYLAIGDALKTTGKTAEAIDSYHYAIAARPGYGEAFWALANLKTYGFSDAELTAMRQGEASSNTTPVDRYHLCFALGKALEDLGHFQESFDYYERGNALKRATLHYRPGALEQVARRQTAVCTPEFFASRRQYGSSSNTPIFIVGLPRSGSTLVEQILGSHSQVDGTLELADIPRLVQELQANAPTGRPGYPELLASLSADACRQLGEKYLADTAAYRTGKARFTDKMPNNFRHLGLLHLILPNACIIDVRRDPMACGFSIFKQLFANGQRFAYSLEEIARYYRMYVELMAHWERVLPEKILRVQYEDLVSDLEPTVRRMLDFCGLGFESGCVEFHRSRRTVHTPSSEQVHQPLYKEGLDQWRNYERWLAPLRRALNS
jgi:tetratricopeptide (TPR) repeat protein